MNRTITLSLCILWLTCFGLVDALAAPKTIAILNMSTSAKSADSAAEARKIISASPELRCTTQGDLSRALEGEFPIGDSDQIVLSNVVSYLEESGKAFASFKAKSARRFLEKARDLLFSLPPSSRSNELLADVSFQMGLIHLRDENRGLALREFRLLHKLHDREGIDPVRFAPDVVKAFMQSRALALAPGTPSSTITVSATYDGAPVYLNGKLVGTAPIELSVSPGTHLVAIAAPQYQTKTVTLDVDPESHETLRIDLKPRSVTLRALEMRFEAKEKGLREEHLRQAAAQAALLVGSDAVLVIVDKGEQLMATLYDQRLDRFSYHRRIDDSLGMLLGLVIETPRPGILEGPKVTPPLPWYRSSIGIAAIGGGTALTIGLLSVLALSADTEQEPVDIEATLFKMGRGFSF